MITSVDERLRYLRFVFFAAILAEGCFFPAQEVMLSSESESESESLLLLEHSELLPESLLLDDDEVEDKLQEELEEDEVLVHEELLELLSVELSESLLSLIARRAVRSKDDFFF